jgi:hypothetical protein
VPSLDLRFADNKSLVDAVTGASLVTFTRASSKTVTNSARVLETVGIDVPAFDHDPTTGESLGLLAEEQRTNLLVQSNGFDTTWVNTNSSETAAAGTAPDGTNTAWEFKDTLDVSSVAHSTGQTISFTSGVTYTFSTWLKQGTLSEGGLTLGAGAFGTTVFCRVNLATGAVISSSAGFTTTVQAFSNGWYRVAFSGTATATASTGVSIRTMNGGASYQGDGTGTILIWGADLQAGAFPTSYIPTTTAAVTRSADVASITGSAFSSWYRQDEGTVFVVGSTKGVTGSSALIQFDDTTTSERIGLRRTQNQDRLACIIVEGGATQANNFIVSPAFIDGATGRCALAVASNNVNIGFNGALSTLDTTATIPIVTQATIGIGVGASYINNCISRITFWPTRLSDASLQQLTQ